MSLLMMNIIVLIFEVLYYALFMKFARKDGKVWKYIILFILITIVLMFIGTTNLYAYLVFVLLSLYGLKYIVKIKTSLYDMLPIIIMLFLKIIIELSSMIIFYNFLGINQFITTLLFENLKILLIIINRKNIFNYNIKLNKIWNQNNFYIRYFFSIFTIIYVIMTIISLLWLIIR